MRRSATPPDQHARERALDPARSILVQAPAGSGKTTLLAERFLTLLARVDEPGEVVAITFTNAAAAEMRNRVLDELRAPEPTALAQAALNHSHAREWRLLDLPAQLRISTIDSFCRELALQQPLLSGLGGGLQVAEQPSDLYRRAARSTMEEISRPGSQTYAALELLLNWRDNGWQELEDLLVEMLGKRHQWMQDFVFNRDGDWEGLRARLERPFANEVRNGLTRASRLLGEAEGAGEEALRLARFACAQMDGALHRELAELAELPGAPFAGADALDDGRAVFVCLCELLLTKDGGFRRRIDKNLGFPADCKVEKAQFAALIAQLAKVSGLEAALGAVRGLPPARYAEDDWNVVRACFTLLRHAAGQLKVVFAEAGRVDFVEVAQIAESVLKGEDGEPTDAAIAVADGIRHLLVDEFQDTSRRQHQLLASLVGAWDDRSGRTLFAVGDPMQSIYFFRDADAELFGRVKEIGLEIPNGEPLRLDFVALSANFRTAPPLVERLNETFTEVFAEDDGSGVRFSAAAPARATEQRESGRLGLNVAFIPGSTGRSRRDAAAEMEIEAAKARQLEQIVALMRSHEGQLAAAAATNEKYRIAVLARTRASLIPIAAALREAQIPFRAVDLEQLGERPEVLDALALGRALLNCEDRVAWLSVLRAPWCGLTLADLHRLTSADDAALLARPIAELLGERVGLLSDEGRAAVQRLLTAVPQASALRAAFPTASAGTMLEQIWLGLGGADCCDRTARANLDLLWSCLDRLPAGERDLPGPALIAAIDKLTALPDPAASSERGVQLMTIHKSKGLEFEVVVVPDLQARTRRGNKKLLSWLERGVDPIRDDPDGAFDPSDAGAITEFLVAPLPSKGADSGQAKVWVDSVYSKRESQEMRRILYVAATRARDQLHLFALARYKSGASGALTLAEPAESLLKTAWPGVAAEVQAQFDAWTSARQKDTAESAELDEEIESIAAAGEVIEIPVARPTRLRRLPADYAAPPIAALALPAASGGLRQAGAAALYARHEGGAVSRALGTAVHSFFEELARLHAGADWDGACAALKSFEPRVAARARAAGIAPAQAARIAADALRLTLSAAGDPVAQWILAPHNEARSEASWTGVLDGALTNVRVDRVFRAGLEPLQEGAAAWWIVDVKTAHAADMDTAAALPELRRQFAPQLEVYARILRNLHGADARIHGGLYYPRMRALDWWEL